MSRKQRARLVEGPESKCLAARCANLAEAVECQLDSVRQFEEFMRECMAHTDAELDRAVQLLRGLPR